MDSRITKVTSSSLRCFKTCRKRYFLEYVQGLKPLETPKALEIGTLYHYGLEMLLGGQDVLFVRNAIGERQRRECAEKGIDFEPLNALIAGEMVDAFSLGCEWYRWTVRAVEKSFEVSTGYAKRLLGKIDGIIEINGKDFLIEHKTTSQWKVDGSEYRHNLLWDEQSTNYLYAYNRMLEDGVIKGSPVQGIFYVIVEKPTLRKCFATPPELRKYTKDGRLYANQRDTDETDAEYIARVREWYQAENRVHDHLVTRTPADIAERIADLNLTIKDMAACEREETYYRNPEACKILPCPYRPKCLDNVPDTDCLFTMKNAKHEELAQ